MFHLRFEIDGELRPAYAWDLPDEDTLRAQYLTPYQRGEAVTVDDRTIPAASVVRLQVFSSVASRAELEEAWLDRADAIANEEVFLATSGGDMWLRFADDRTPELLGKP
jgi:hypothetical protein